MDKKFVIDKQTLEDLNLLGKYKSNSIYSLFNHTMTRGGEMSLERMFLNPLTNAAEINSRKDVLAFFQQAGFTFPFVKEEFDIAERYLTNIDSKNIIGSVFNNFKRKSLKLIANNEEFDLLQNGFVAAISILKKLESFMKGMENQAKSTVYQKAVENALRILHDKNLAWIYSDASNGEYKFWKFAVYDHKLRYSAAGLVIELLNLIYDLDVYIAVTKLGRERGFVYANAEDKGKLNIDIKGVYHPCVPNAVANDIHLDYESNVLFLTGANMAGKSTLMKSFGVSLYLAHMGFPLAVKSMDFTVQDGMYTSINVPDNLNLGYSHFYAEVIRVKNIAIEVSSGKNLMIMFDELFKGTNVKDAYDATVAVTEAFSIIRECAFIVSTHIMEAGINLKERCKNISFKYLPTVMRGSVPEYTYTLNDGISDDRHGMMIINNEKIIEIIKRTTEQP